MRVFDTQWEVEEIDEEVKKMASDKEWIEQATKVITELAGGGSELFVRHGDGFRADLSFCRHLIRDRLNRAHEQMVEAVKDRKASAATINALKAVRADILDYWMPCTAKANIIKDNLVSRIDAALAAQGDDAQEGTR